MSALALLHHADLYWIADALDMVERCAGQPWRIALERLDDLQRADHAATPRRFAAVVGAIRRLTARDKGRARDAAAPREARRLVLGTPALDAHARCERIARAAEALDMSPAALETLLWADVPRERPVELPGGRPSELVVAAVANVALVQRALRHAQAITLRTSDDAGPLLRATAQRGLLVTASVVHDITTLDIVGPLALCHRTSVYGRALGEVAPLLGALDRFRLEIQVETQTAAYTLEVASPVLLPEPPLRLAAVPVSIERLARRLERAGRGLVVTRAPQPVLAGSQLVCPDLAIERAGRRWCVELVGFWTATYVARKLATYRAAGCDVVLCLDTSRACSDDLPPQGCVAFTGRLAIDPILERIEAESR